MCSIYICIIYVVYICGFKNMVKGWVIYRCYIYMHYVCMSTKPMFILCLGRILHANTKEYGSYIQGCNVYLGSIQCLSEGIMGKKS